MEENNSKEINLLQLISLFFNWLKKVVLSILNFFAYILRLTYRHKVTFVVVMLACIIIGQYFARQSARTYKAEAMAMLYGSDAQTVKEIFKQLEFSGSSNKLTSLATKLSLPDSVTNNIVEFHSFFVIDYLKDKGPDKVDFENNHSLSDTTNVRMTDRIYLQIKTKNINQIPQVQAAMINYLNNNQVLKSQFNIKKSEFIQQINICELEIHRIDSLAKISYFKDSEKQLQFENNKLLMGEQKKQLFYDDLLRLQAIKSYAEIKLGDYKQAIDLPSGFVINPMPLNGRMKIGVYSIIIGLIISLLLFELIENRKKIEAFLKKNN